MLRLVRWISVLALVGCVGCGGVNYRYSAGYARPVQALQGGPALVSEALDARAGGAPSANPSHAAVPVDAELSQMRRSVREHAARAGIQSGSAMGAPRNAQELEAVLQQAARQGLSELLFIRYHGASYAEVCFSTGILAIWIGILPWLILDSLPINSHGATSTFEAIVVDPAGRQVLARSLRTGAYGENVSAWGCGGNGVMLETMGRAVQAALEDVAAQRASGYPARSRANLAQVLFGESTIRLVGRQLIGPGWSVEAPAGWQVVQQQVQVAAPVLPPGSLAASVLAQAPATPAAYTFRSPDGAVFSITHGTNNSDGGVFIAGQLNPLRIRPGVTVIDQPHVFDRFVVTRDSEMRTATGELELHRVVSPGGAGLHLTCSGPAQVMAARRAECQRAFDSLRVHYVTR